MEPKERELAALFQNVAGQMRGTLSNLHLSIAQLVPTNAREQDPELDSRVARLDQSYYQLLRLVNNLTQLAGFADDQPFTLKNRDLVSFVGELCECAAEMASFLNLNVRFSCAMERYVCAICPDALEQILNHLLSNAFKHTPAGGTVTVELRVVRRNVLISVVDTGRGIPPERMETLFDGYRHANAMDPLPHGVGLGLPLCRSLAEKHDGTLMATSEVGKGTRITLSLPDRQVEDVVLDAPFDYGGGFNRTLLAFADVLPVKAFLMRNQD